MSWFKRGPYELAREQLEHAEREIILLAAEEESYLAAAKCAKAKMEILANRTKRLTRLIKEREEMHDEP